MSRLLIQLSHVFKSFNALSLFDDIFLSISQGEVFALVGENGAGKTTLLQLVTGEMLPDAGKVLAAPHLSIGYLPQKIPPVSSDISVRAYIEEGPLSELEQQMASCLQSPDKVDEWAELHEKYEQLGGYRRQPVEKILSGLKLDTALLDLPMHTLSSGQKVRVALARALIDNPSLLLLDEPTSHLDADMLLWLQKTLHQREGATILVSHDRKFLNETCNRLLELKCGKLTRYGGSYNFYLDEQQQALIRQIKAYEAQQEDLRNTKQKIKAITFSKRKAAPPTDRNLMAYDRRGEHHQRSLQHNLDVLKAHLEELETNLLPHPRPKSITGLKFSSTPLASSVAIQIDHISKAYGHNVLFSECNEVICRGDRIVITGPNGSGKTTLLRCIAGLLPVDAGQVRLGPSTKIAYLDQDVELLPMHLTPLEYFESRFSVSEEALRRELHMAAIGGSELLRRPFSTLSLGQKKRFMLLSLLLEKPNVLLLDEPTNHLDFLTLEAFESALLNFDGAIVAVSHDAAFTEKIATKKWQLLNPTFNCEI